MKIIIKIICVVLISSLSGFSQAASVDSVMAKIDSGLTHLQKMQKKIEHIHPFLEIFYPVAVYEYGKLYIYDYDSDKNVYVFIRKTDAPFPMPDGIRASFPLSVNENKPTCIVSPDVFDTRKEMVLIFHEFMHCHQYSMVELKIKERLKIYQKAMTNKDYMWELQHPFPYKDSVFVSYYDWFLKALSENDTSRINQTRQRLREHLGEMDYEYMVWQEWKEGFARFIENEIKDEFNMPSNDNGKDKPYNRVTFYYGGEAFANYLFEKNHTLKTDLKTLFYRMFEL